MTGQELRFRFPAIARAGELEPRQRILFYAKLATLCEDVAGREDFLALAEETARADLLDQRSRHSYTHPH